MRILAIETSCDDTCAAVLENDRILSNVISSQTDLHAKWGGVVPDIAKRAHMERIEPVIIEALIKSNLSVLRTSPLKKGRSLFKIKIWFETLVSSNLHTWISPFVFF